MMTGLLVGTLPATAQAPATTSAQSVRLPSGTPITLRLRETLSSENLTEGATVDLSVTSDVRVDDKVVIRAGETARATVSQVEENKVIGQPGKIVISDFHTLAVDGTRVPLTATLSAKGQDKMVMSVALGVIICLPFLLIKGKDATIPAGTEKTVYTSTDITVKLAH